MSIRNGCGRFDRMDVSIREQSVLVNGCVYLTKRYVCSEWLHRSNRTDVLIWKGCTHYI